MTNLTEIEQDADREARHGHRELVERLEEENRELALQVIASQGQADEALGRVAELEAALDADGGPWRYWNRKAVEKADECMQLRARVAELEAGDKTFLDGVIDSTYDTAWNDAIRAAASLARYCHPRASHMGIAEAIRTLLRNEGGEK